MKIKHILNEVEIDTYSVPKFYKKLGQQSQVIRPTILRHTKDIGDLYVHAKSGIRDIEKAPADTTKVITNIDQIDQGAAQPSEQPSEQPAEKSVEKVAKTDKKPISQNVPKLYSITTKSGIKISKHNDGLWRTPEGQVLDDPTLINALENLATAQRQTAQMAPGYQPMPPSSKVQRRRR